MTDLEDNQVISYVDYFLKERDHFYSYPYTLRYYHTITKSFLGSLFKCIRKVLDDRPFEDEFFLRIAQAFPLMEKLSLVNRTPQKQKATDNNEHLAIIEYPHLIESDFSRC